MKKRKELSNKSGKQDSKDILQRASFLLTRIRFRRCEDKAQAKKSESEADTGSSEHLVILTKFGTYIAQCF